MLVSLPTGTGKTIIFAQFPNYFRMLERAPRTASMRARKAALPAPSAA